MFFFNKILKSQNIIYGNYINNFNLIRLGMTKKEILMLFGAPLLNNTKNKNIWLYIYRKEYQDRLLIIQKTLVIKFNGNIVTDFIIK
ncbi:MAG: outer membrane protein assembly factor BamE [Candidatus Lightella neohaematopini]|nr:outer membrane protein assembly factor BamE [Candidatus Lightella neohaematopini]MCV2529009.1 outer membrane protein assembly factor BamE [Candidatus Lightella neohaematopini]